MDKLVDVAAWLQGGGRPDAAAELLQLVPLLDALPDSAVRAGFHFASRAPSGTVDEAFRARHCAEIDQRLGVLGVPVGGIHEGLAAWWELVGGLTGLHVLAEDAERVRLHQLIRTVQREYGAMAERVRSR